MVQKSVKIAALAEMQGLLCIIAQKKYENLGKTTVVKIKR